MRHPVLHRAAVPCVSRRPGALAPLLLAAALGLAACGGDQNWSTAYAPAGSGSAAPVVGGLTGNNSLSRRALPSVYASGHAVAYSAYRAGGPNAGEIPADSSILQDLQLLSDAGYNLLRLFGADAVSTRIVSLASQNFPAIKIQLGIYLEGAPASCVDTVNQAQITTAVGLANQFAATVVSVSVGNETSFANNLPVSCLASYVSTVKKNVAQPVTADDDYTFYAGLSGANEKPDTVLPLLDFVSYHSYPISTYNSWNWQQTSVASGPARAQAMMQAALAKAQSDYALVAAYPFTTSAGQATTIGASLPLVIGETGWKARQTNTASPIETYAANPVNEKWYFDLLAGWQAAGGNAPLTIFAFEGFDEAWKGVDDGWGLWDATRTPRYVLCGMSAVPGAPACATPLYAGAGSYP